MYLSLARIPSLPMMDAQHGNQSDTLPPFTCQCLRRRRIWKSRMISQEVTKAWMRWIAILLILEKAQKIQRDYKAKISSQSKKNFVLEKDVRYLDSRIALLIQNRMALEEVGPMICSDAHELILTSSKMKSQIISKMLQICKKDSSPTMRKHKSTATSSSYFNRSLAISHIYAGW